MGQRYGGVKDNLFRGGETSSTGLPTVQDEHAAGEVG